MNSGKATGSFSSVESSAALRRLFSWIESRYGGLPLDIAASPILVSQGKLETAQLLSLVRHEATAVHVRGFYPRASALQLGRELACQNTARNWKINTSRGMESSDVYTLGEHAPFNIVSSKRNREQAQNEYFEGVLRELDQRRWRSCAENAEEKLPQLWPLDLLRLQLDECWPAGAGLGRESTGQNRPYSGGLPRIMKGPTRWRKGYIHVDEMAPLNQNKGLFSANIYLQLPPNECSDDQSNSLGQEVLHVWPVGIRSRWDWYRNALLLSGLSSQDPEDQVRLRLALGKPVSIFVEPGDLVLLCVQRPHAAIGFQSGTRVSLQCFLQHQGAQHRLLIDS
jgi:hypothetical protein